MVDSKLSNIKAEIIKDSISSETGERITTYVLEYPRFVHCFDMKTEVMAKVGNSAPEFMHYKRAYGLRADIGQYNPEDDSIEFVAPEAYITKTDKMKMVNFNKKKFSMSVTDEHRVFTHKRTTGNKFIADTVLAKDLVEENYGTRRIPQAGYCDQVQEATNEELQLVAWFVSDGHRENHKTSSFHLKKKRKIKTVEELLAKCEIEYKKFTYEQEVILRFDSPWWVGSCYNAYKEKVIPDLFQFMSQEGYELFKKALLESDGNVDNNEYNNSSKELMDQIQAIAVLHGDAMNIRSYKNGLYKQKFQSTNYISLRHDKDVFEETEVKESVWCVSVPSSYLLVRRDGIPYVSGNCEFMTHRMFSRNAASSRAIPIDKVIDLINYDMAMPQYWGLNKSGMQAKEEHSDINTCKHHWVNAAGAAIECAEGLKDLGLHKQIVNRVLEPFQMIKVIVTATEYDNFFWLRCHKDAQPEIKILADKMYQAREESKPRLLQEGQWHLPFIEDNVLKENQDCFIKSPSNSDEFIHVDLEEAKKYSAACCAAVSYRTEEMTMEKAERIYSQLIESVPCHASPVEHQATPIGVVKALCPFIRGVTHEDRDQNLWSGNFKGWIQNRQLIPNNVCKDYNKN